MPTCDFCNEPVSASEMRVLTGDRVQGATLAGYLPKHLPPHYQGMGPGEKRNASEFLVESYADAQWGVCLKCHNHFHQWRIPTAVATHELATVPSTSPRITVRSAEAAVSDQARRRASLTVLVAIAKADGVIAPSENEILRKFCAHFNIAQAEIDDALSRPLTVKRDLLPQVPQEKRRLAIDVFRVALADGAIDASEQVVIDKLFAAMKLRPEEMTTCREKARKLLGLQKCRELLSQEFCSLADLNPRPGLQQEVENQILRQLTMQGLSLEQARRATAARATALAMPNPARIPSAVLRLPSAKLETRPVDFAILTPCGTESAAWRDDYNDVLETLLHVRELSWDPQISEMYLHPFPFSPSCVGDEFMTALVMEQLRIIGIAAVQSASSHPDEFWTSRTTRASLKQGCWRHESGFQYSLAYRENSK